MLKNFLQQGRDERELRFKMELIWRDGGLDSELYRAVSDWQIYLRKNRGKPIKGSIKGRDWPQMVDSLLPLLAGVDDARAKAILYFRDGIGTAYYRDTVAAIRGIYPSANDTFIDDRKFGQRSDLWETMVMYIDKGGIIINGKLDRDIPGVVLGVIGQLDPSIAAELSEGSINRK